jgi:hypothetical protein
VTGALNPWSAPEASPRQNEKEEKMKTQQAIKFGAVPTTCVALAGLWYFTLPSAHAGSIYWTDYDGGDIRRANLDGSGVQTLSSSLPGPAGIGLDLVHGWMYFTEYNSGNLLRANLDGTGRTLLKGGVTHPTEWSWT